MKVIFIDGPQQVGKSTLIEGLSNKYGWRVLKFPFSKYSSLFGLSSKEELKGFQLGKDLSAMYWLSQFADCEEVVLVDRGPLSSAYYSITDKRMSGAEVSKLIKELASFGSNFKYFFITSCGDKDKVDKRSKNDGFDELDLGTEDIDAVLKIGSDAFWSGIDFHLFCNDFSLSPEENYLRLGEIIEGVI